MPKNPSRKLPLQQHSLATVLFFLRVWQFSLLSKLFLFNLFNGFNIFKSVGRGYFFSSRQFAFVCQRALRLRPGPALIFRIGHDFLDNIPPIFLPLLCQALHIPLQIYFTLYLSTLTLQPLPYQPLVLFFGFSCLNLTFVIISYIFPIFIFRLCFIDNTASALTSFPSFSPLFI